MNTRRGEGWGGNAGGMARRRSAAAVRARPERGEAARAPAARRATVEWRCSPVLSEAGMASDTRWVADTPNRS